MAAGVKLSGHGISDFVCCLMASLLLQFLGRYPATALSQKLECCLVVD